MNLKRMIDSLERFAEILPTVVHGVSADDARWKHADGAWSILEIVTHLADEEVEDFRTRVELTLRDPAEPWPPIDPETWAVDRRYNEGDLVAALGRFISERHKSIAWLRGLHRPDWSQTHTHPKLGPLRAGDIFAAWVAHDALHLRQIAKRMHQMTQRDAGVYTVHYAGRWTS
ncbi:MAG: DinB family protein [Planctomycetota bacterium]|nr:DinB family protein [Planctomycetota bacterium]